MSLEHAPLCIELHDVAPATWPLCVRLLDVIDAIGPLPVSLLVVPDYHGRGRITSDARFLRAMAARLARGDEIALHGLDHRDHGPVSRTPAEWLRRRVRTLSEGEFAATDATISAERMAAGLAECVAAGWRVRGFVPPAWLLGAGARRALDGFAFSYVALRDGVIALPQWRTISTTTLSYAAFSAWRRVLSRPVLDVLLRRAAPERPLRLALHPVDARFDGVVEHWRTLLQHASSARQAMTVAQLVELCRDGGWREPRRGDRSRARKRGRAGVASRP